jgi:hypothetical protein
MTWWENLIAGGVFVVIILAWAFLMDGASGGGPQ